MIRIRERHDIGACGLETNFLVYPASGTARLREKLDYIEARHLNLFRPP